MTEQMSKYSMRRGVMPIPGTSFPTQIIAQGQQIPARLLKGMDIDEMLEEGVIEIFREPAKGEQAAPAQSPGKWGADPSTLLGLDMEALLERILTIDPDFEIDEIDNEAKAMSVLTADFVPAFSEMVSPSSDRTTPGMTTQGARSVPQEGDAKLDAAREQAGSSEASGDSQED